MAPKKSAPRKQYFDSIKSQKLDALKWCLRHGGISTRAEDDDGHTGLQIAAAGGYDAAMEIIIENIKKVGTADDMEAPDDDGRTPLMMASHAGKIACVRLLVTLGKARLDTKCEKGKTARTYAADRKNEQVVRFLDDPKRPPTPEPESEEDEAETQKRVFMASQRTAATATASKAQEEVHRARVEAAEALEKALADAPKPLWAEVKPVIKETRRELSIRGKEAVKGPTGPVDPAVWNCVCLFELRLELAERALVSLPPQLARLIDLTTLIVSNNALAELPAEIGLLKKLKNLEAAANELSALPAELAKCTQLQVLDVSTNRIDSLAPLSELRELVGVNAGHNQLTSLPLAWEHLEHMQSLAAPHNAIVEFPAGIGLLPMLGAIDLASNKIVNVPMELGSLTVKKLQTVALKDNPLADARIRRFVEEDQATMVKDLLNHVRKNGFKAGAGGGGSGKKGKKGKKGKAEVVKSESESDGDMDDAMAAMLANMGGASDSD